ncbi:hypothetical protein LEP1GSC016_1777 [Leptospira borgpetersenii serovar Hardjo-bovis str. Sponselee]|uniref:Uncharacterized protein n=1 Tax=Leptospira borgpetersenii serovar Hardjo-bovis str. Sponselee TaxID=1303729 RepID=M6BWW0_LEPBO|nr:hypothetical protein [Leptospira borgpetersenii]AMX57322.1 hypothetical protein LBK6_02690 [Leptospira borgpetersenii serovar Hardjo]AMX60553.1 hypothetical protein LBK9_02625 [Leptospira borgpetersenii serovar Hardjo]AMX63799.1 hypothetical protein LBK30_02685 [Leptospira borgpetersenii serovar Hardjo]AMX67039.1 hypothetical protein LBHA_02645 [Leptospira borgpetersenii serovar Hardjo]AWV69226.1 hypothetical protein B9T54_02855 [Leptospira borgpetersenii serovar Hardjo-bovis]
MKSYFPDCSLPIGKKKLLSIYLLTLFIFEGSLRQNGAPSGLEKRGLDASYHKTKKPTEGTQ